ncbi:amidohydrolase [Rhizobium sp. Root274]|uniref:amidohydrolase family protein n=1 Tax=unclassified Rhizobium TaxID=2613769 RepID=UPI000713591D|nr:MULTISPECIES: amidohydrolase [unclassified Rhizobium]KQW29459.1 amidohydrolase [Rhizobium sp. Root1240]KRD29650.1 amidohydrolase [Rhizobium sp. Root274]
MIIDTHLHLIYRDRLTYPWLKSEPALDADFTYERYTREARRLGISSVLHMEVDVAVKDISAETEMMQNLSREPGSLLRGVIAACRPEDPGFAAYLETQRANPFVKGFRRVLHVVPDDVSEGALFRENIKRLAGTGLTFDLCMFPHQIDKAKAMIDLAPDVTFILDHCGVPDIKGHGYAKWKTGISEIAERDNVRVKISGIPAYGDLDNWTLEDLKPYFEHTIGAFGFNRAIWGSDWPVCTLGGGLSTWVATTQALLHGCTVEEKETLFSKNAKRIWQLD